MLPLEVLAAYVSMNVIFAVMIMFKSPRNHLSQFYAICVAYLVILGVPGYFLSHPLQLSLVSVLQNVVLFLFAVFPFLFFHLVVILVRAYGIMNSPWIIFANYLVGGLCYLLILLKLIPAPLFEVEGISEYGYTFYLTWHSILFCVGIALMHSVVAGFSDKQIKTNLLVRGFMFLLLLLPGPFTATIFFSIIPQHQEWFFYTSIISLVVAIYLIFRHKIIINTPYEILKTSIGIMNDVLIKTDDTFRIELVRGSFASMLGYDEKDLVGRSLVEIVEEKYLLEAYRDFVFRGKMKECFFDAEVICKNSSRLPVFFSLNPIKMGNEVTGFVALGRNIIERKQFEEELHKERNSLEQRVQARTTELEQLNEILRESEKKYRSLVERANDGITIIQDEVVKFANNRLAEMWGGTVEEILGTRFINYIHPDELPKVVDRYRRRLAGEPVISIYETVLKRRDGSDVNVELNAGVITYQQKPADLLIVRDTTERKRAELLERAVYRIAQAPEFAVSLNDLFMSVHKIIKELMPADNFYIALYDENEDLVSFPYFVDEKDTTPAPLKLGKGFTGYVLRTGNSLLADLERQEEMIREREVEAIGAPASIWLGVPLKTEGKTIGVMTVQHYSNPKVYGEREKQILEYVSSQVANAIQRKRHREAIESQQSYFQQLFESSPLGIAMLDTNDAILNANRAFEKMFAFSLEDIRGHNINKLIVPESLTDEGNQLSLQSQGGKTIQAQTKRKRKDGSLIDVSIVGYPIVIEDKVVGVYGMYADMTEQKRLEDQLRQAQKLESLGRLAGGIAHDFNNILSIIIGRASLIESLPSDPAVIKKNTDIITKAGLRAADLVKQMLTFARKADVLIEPLSLNDIVKEVTKLLGETFPKTIVITTNLEDDLPPIEADTTQVHQVLLNLCMNARDAMPSGGILTINTHREGGEKIQTRIPRATADEYIALTVADTGVGMNEETQRLIFEPFFTTKERGKGTGLGLALVFSIMESYNGFADVQSELRKGTTFRCYFPVPEEPIGLEQLEEIPAEIIPRGIETILLVEDEEPLRESAKTMLELNGYAVLTAEDGEEGIEVYKRNQKEIAVVLSDLGLPKLGGRDMLRKIREINPNVKIIFASGYVDPQTKSELFKAGAKFVLHKPYMKNEVLKKIREVIDSDE
jgi:PAS domain S-box-containing protein